MSDTLSRSDPLDDDRNNGEAVDSPDDDRRNAAASPAGPDPEVMAALAAVGAGSRRRWPAALMGLVVGAAGTWAALSVLDRDDEAGDVEVEVTDTTTATVEQRDLIEEVEWDGTLGYGTTVAVVGNGGVVTGATAVGDTLVRGDVAMAVDGDPVVVFYGDTPPWRTVREGDEGVDVLQLEANLVALGHDTEQTVDVDGVFTANTEAMVERWQTEIGAEVTGTVAAGDIVVLEGPSLVATAPDVGGAATGPVMEVAPTRAVTDLVVDIDGIVSNLAPEATVVEHGTVVARIDDGDVIALTTAAAATDPVARELLSATFTVLELEEALAAAGFDPDGEMTVDGLLTEATEAAVVRWQETNDLATTGATDPARYVAVPEGRSVEAQLVADGDAVIGGGPVLTLSTSRLSAEVVVEVADADEFAEGDVVAVQLADESTAEGRVVELGPVTPGANQQAAPTVTVVIEVAVDADREVVVGPVVVLTTGDTVPGATVVPTRALISLAEGGFAVEKVGPDGTPALVGIELGTFDDGVVEVIDGDLAPGDEIVVPS
ncbi:MAG: peptidoglycan-binding protein [Actinomycetota bacterium]